MSATTQGGILTVQAGGAVQIDGTVTARGTATTGGTAGSISLTAGTAATVSATGLVLASGGENGGEVVIISSTDLRVASALAAHVDVGATQGAGGIRLQTTGTGRVLLDGILNAAADTSTGGGGAVLITGAARHDARASTAQVKANGGDLGGQIGIDGSGPIELKTLSGASPTIDVSARSQGGSISTDAVGAGMTLVGLLKANASLSDGSGGTIDIEAGGNVTLSGHVDGRVAAGVAFGVDLSVTGPVTATGGDGGSIDLRGAGGVSTSAAALLDVSGDNIDSAARWPPRQHDGQRPGPGHRDRHRRRQLVERQRHRRHARRVGRRRRDDRRRRRPLRRPPRRPRRHLPHRRRHHLHPVRDHREGYGRRLRRRVRQCRRPARSASGRSTSAGAPAAGRCMSSPRPSTPPAR